MNKIQLENTCNKMYRVFGFLPLPKEYIIKLLVRGIDADTIFGMACDAHSNYKNVIKNKYYIF